MTFPQNRKDYGLKMTLKRLFSELYPEHDSTNSLGEILQKVSYILTSKEAGVSTRTNGKYDIQYYQNLYLKYRFPNEPSCDPLKSITKLLQDFFNGVPLLQSSKMYLNIGAPVNVYSSAILAIAQNYNICGVNEDSAGATLAAEKILVSYMSKLAKINPQLSSGFFTFGGTGTILCAMKIGICKSQRNVNTLGIKPKIFSLVTHNAHYSHKVCADWLGMGRYNAVVMPPTLDGATDILKAEKLARKFLDAGGKLSSIILNGGTTYDHIIDDIQAFVEMRKRLITDYDLEYSPHIHVDSVIGWSWLTFNGYNFKKNIHNIPKEALHKIFTQKKKIESIRLADSWGVDFHKGIGGCPIPCSVFIVNNKNDLTHISKRLDPNTNMHQIVQEMSSITPSEFTLETSRQTGAALAALLSMNILGKSGYQQYLGNLTACADVIRATMKNNKKEMCICNPHSNGFCVVFRLYPFGISAPANIKSESKKHHDYINDYNKSFFIWYIKGINKSWDTEFSYSEGYTKLNGTKIICLKFYLASPHYEIKHMPKVIENILSAKHIFDKEVWASL